MLQTPMDTPRKLLLVDDDQYCQACSTVSSINGNRRLSCFACDHCQLPMCYDCFEKHTAHLVDEYSQVQRRLTQLSNLFSNKRELLDTFEQHCLRNVDTVFDEVLSDLQTLRNESAEYIKQQFSDAETAISDIMADIKPLTFKSQHVWTHDNVKTNIMRELDSKRKQIDELEQRLEQFSLPDMRLKMLTYPRNRLDLHCQLLANPSKPPKEFASGAPGKSVFAQCSYKQSNESEGEKIVVDTEIEEFTQTAYSTKQIQTDSLVESIHDTDDDEDEYFSLQDETSDFSSRIIAEQHLSTRYTTHGTIVTQHEVDRIASDGEHLLYFSDTLKLLCYVRDAVLNERTEDAATTREITCRWPHYPILDLVYSPAAEQFICATRKGLYTCTIDSRDDSSTIDIQMQLTQQWSYVRLSADGHLLWLWADTPRLSQLQVYSPKTFHCIKIFNLSDHSRFSDNSTSFCVHKSVIATVFQFKQLTNASIYKKNFHLTFCDTADLHELCTIRLGECDIDHEIRASHDGTFFLTNGKKKLWIIDRTGRKEFVKLQRAGRALAVHGAKQILIANGTQQLQCVELLENDEELI